MSSRLRGPLLRRMLREHRALVIPIVVLVLVNVAVYAAVIHPLSGRVNTVTERTQAAETELAAARLAHTRATRAVTGKSQAFQALDEFYRTVLPSDLPAARRLVFPRLELMARQLQLRVEHSTVERVADNKRTLTQLKIRVDLTGSYRAIREFIHRLEGASEFLVIDGIRVHEGSDNMAPLTLQIDLSTFYKRGAE